MVKKLDKSQRIARAKLAGESRRSEELKLAWQESSNIKAAYELGVTVKEICNKYAINYRSAYRIIKSK